jgi:hypothetical protein
MTATMKKPNQMQVMNTEIKEASHVPWPRPDYQDLSHWFLDYSPEGYHVLQYVTPASSYDAMLVCWHNAGRPTNDFESALFTSEEALEEHQIHLDYDDSRLDI